MSSPGLNVTAAHEDGRPYRPSVFEIAELLAAWRPKTAAALDIPPSTDWKLVAWAPTSGKNNRIDMPSWAAWRQRRLVGYVAEISETTSGNSDIHHFSRRRNSLF